MGDAHPEVVVWLQVLVAKVVREFVVALATNTFPSDESRPIASGFVPVVTEPDVAKSDGLLVVPSPSTLTVLEDLLATYTVPVEASTTWATGSDPVGAETTPLTLQPSEPWSPVETKTDCPSTAAACRSVFSEFWSDCPT